MLTASTSALTFLLLTACGGEAETSEAASSAEPDADTSEAPQRDSGAEEEDEDSAPIPASSDGPAQNWPEPEIPEEIYEETEGGAEALLYYWWEVLNYARNTGDTDLLEQFSSGECIYCQHEVDLTRELYDEENGWWVNEAPAINNTYSRLEDDGESFYIFTLDSKPFELYIDGEHDYTADDPHTDVGWTGWGEFNGEHWVTSELQIVDPEQVGEQEESG
ncbi:DUF6318 family protein [Nesterenkonia populi]|uniref:DUF6318 family protein n=1 Tax=Nesterenkonia populi TaxID=1591087 RepID=UPI0011BD6C5E|nr:DUF6318 family protein [Nesterenkonia populi]